MSKSAPYHRLSAGAKQAAHRERMREPAVPCPHCEAQTTVADLIRHVESSCPGQRDPHPLSRWITWGEAMEMGVGKQTLSRWINRGMIHSRIRARRTDEERSRGRPAQRVYLARDVARRIAARLGPKRGTK